MRYVFEIIDSLGDSRCIVGELMRRETDMLVLHHRGEELAVEISMVSDWFAVDDDQFNQMVS